jgi:hypothetical protein
LGVDPQPADAAIASLIDTMNKGQYLLLVSAVRQLGGELRIDATEFMKMAVATTPKMNVDASDGPIVLRLEA